MISTNREYPQLVEIVHRVPEGGVITSYEFIKPGLWTHYYDCDVPPDHKFNPRGYHGQFILQCVLSVRPNNGDVITVGGYKVRIIEWMPWWDSYTAVLDKPLSRLHVWRSKLLYTHRWIEGRIWRTLRLCNVIDWNIEEWSATSSHYPPITHIFGRKRTKTG